MVKWVTWGPGGGRALSPSTERSADILSHSQLPQHLPQTRSEHLGGDPSGRHREAVHPLNSSRWPLRREKLPRIWETILKNLDQELTPHLDHECSNTPTQRLLPARARRVLLQTNANV